jgi:predicted N-acetyltransferase YhbS
MGDLLVKLYSIDFDSLPERERKLENEHHVRINRLLSPNFDRMKNFINEVFGGGWASEATASFYRSPISCFAAANDKKEVVGFACYDSTALGFFGPTGVRPDMRKKDIGTLLLLRCLQSMKELGYGYAIIGSAGPVDYYKKIVNAEPIPDSAPGVYKRLV